MKKRNFLIAIMAAPFGFIGRSNAGDDALRAHRQDTLAAEMALNDLRQYQLSIYEKYSDELFSIEKQSKAFILTAAIFMAAINMEIVRLECGLLNDRQKKMFKNRADLVRLEFKNIFTRLMNSSSKAL